MNNKYLNNKNIVNLTIFLVLCLITLGGIVHNTQSSLACPDWPLCYGKVFPHMVGGVLLEHSHRLLASLVGLFSIVIVILSRKNYLIIKRENTVSSSQTSSSSISGSSGNDNDIRITYNKKICIISGFALFCVILQGLLGGITVIYKLPTIVSSLHLALSMVVFLIFIYLSHTISLDQKILSSQVSSTNNFKLIDSSSWKFPSSISILFALFILYSQILLGAFVRHSGAGVACGLGPSNAFSCLDQSTWEKTFFPTTLISQINFFHRVWAIVTFFAIVFALIKFFMPSNYRLLDSLKPLTIMKKYVVKSFKTLPALTIFLVFFQISLGIMTVISNISVSFTAMHLFFAALLLGVLFKLFLVVKDVEVLLFKESKILFFADLVEMMKPKLCGLILATVLVGILLGAPANKINFFTALITVVFTAFLAWGSAILNCYIEIDVDKLMSRTSNRPLPSGRFNPLLALLFGIAFIVIGFIGLFLMVNMLTATTGLLAAILYLLVYTPLKKKSALFIIVGAIVGALPPLIGVFSVNSSFSALSLFLFLFLFIWQIPHFVALSLYYKNDYQNADIIILPLRLGNRESLNILVASNMILVLISVMPYFLGLNDRVYLFWSSVLGIVMILYSLMGYKKIDKSDFTLECNKNKYSWPYKYFILTIIYLPLVMLGLLFFR